MKLLLLTILLSLAAAPAAARQTPALERRAAADPAVSVTLCLTSGTVVVRGSDSREVRARAGQGGALALETDGGAQPARRVEVLVGGEEDEGRLHAGDCGMTGSLELSVPRGATVNVRVHDGDVVASDVAELRVNSLSGHIDARGVARTADLVTMSGDISLADSKGRARLRAVSGNVEATRVVPLAAGDTFEAASTSGDVTLEGVTHARVNGSAISGNVRAAGPLARGAAYELKTISGDVTMALPNGSSFRLSATVVTSGEIITDFPVRTTSTSADGEDPPDPPAPPTPPGGPHPRPKPGRRAHAEEPQPTRLVGVVGTGDASVSLSSFSGTIHLKRQ